MTEASYQPSKNPELFTGNEKKVRRAVFTALREFMSQENRIRALLILDKKHKHKIDFSVGDFVDDLCQNDKLRNWRQQMCDQISFFLAGSDDNLEPDPQPLINKYRIEHPEIKMDLPISRHCQAFGHLFRAYVGKLIPEQRAQLKRILKLRLNDLKLNEELHATLSQWVLGNDELKVQKGTVEELQGVINQAYIAICELEGPVVTDRLLQQVVNDARRTFPELESAIKELL